MINHPYFDELRKNIREKNNSIAERRSKWIKRNPYFYRQLIKSLKFIIEEDASVLHVRCGIGYVLNELGCKKGVGVSNSEGQIALAKQNYPHLTFYQQETEALDINEKFDYIIVSSVEDIVDIKATLDSLKKCCSPKTRIILLHYNYLWNPLVRFAESTGLRLPQKVHNWITVKDLRHFLRLSNFEEIIYRGFLLFPFNIPVFSYLLNRFFARLPFFRLFTMMRITVARMNVEAKEYSVSIVIPCRNEAGNIENAVTQIPPFGTNTEIIFGDDKSTDGTPDIVRAMMQKYPEKNIRLVDSPGICKAQNVWTCFDAAQNDILMILDADLTVVPQELPYFYEAISKGHGEFINGSRLVYPMHKSAMRLFNVLGNKFFSLFFTYILDTPIKDTLCGTKVLFRDDFQKVKALRGTWGIDDRWGDYELIFGAAKRHLKIIDLPVHYYERVYGETKMTDRFKNGAIMFKMSWAALFKIKFY